MDHRSCWLLLANCFPIDVVRSMTLLMKMRLSLTAFTGIENGLHQSKVYSKEATNTKYVFMMYHFPHIKVFN